MHRDNFLAFCLQHSAFCRFVTESHVVYLALKVLKMDHLQDVPENSVPSATKAKRSAIITNMSNKILNEIWMLPNAEDIRDVLDADVVRQPYEWCICRQSRSYKINMCNPE